MNRKHVGWIICCLGLTAACVTSLSAIAAEKKAETPVAEKTAIEKATDKPASDKPAPSKSIGRKIEAFTAPNYQGAPKKLSDLAGQKITVVAFLGTECPLARMYGPRLATIATELAPQGVNVIGIVSNVQDSAEDVDRYAKDCEIKFPILLDADCKLADQFGAMRTPEVFVLDAENVVRYRGRVDDQFGVGVKRPEVARRDLAEAVTELLAGKPVTEAETDAPGCLIGRPKLVAADSTITYSKHIAPMLNARCVICHREGEIGPFPLTSYDETVGWADTIAEVVDAGRMPPWFASPDHGKFINDSRLSDQEKETFRTWAKNGCPPGDVADLPPKREFPEGWSIPKPEVVLQMRKEPYRVPATGVVGYQHFVADPGFTEDKWVVASEVRPGNRAVVHHVLVFLLQPGDSAAMRMMSGELAGAYAPGAPPRQTRPGVALKIPAGTKILFQVHYTTNGKEQEDISSLGLKLCDAKDVKQEVKSGWAVNFALSIPPGAANHPVTSQFRFQEDRVLLHLTPHMHVRGKSFKYEARYPDGTREVLLDVPNFDFNWQIDYILAEPKLMPKGTLLSCTATYDNSAGNPSNPDPTRRVRFGEQTWDEMMIGWFSSATLPADASKESASAVQVK